MSLEKLLDDIAEVIVQENDFLAVSHAGPDGDAIGSLLAIGEILQHLGKRYTLYNVDGVPDGLRFLPHSSRVQNELPAEPAAWTIVLDCNVPDRVSDEFKKRKPFAKAIVLDHHLTERTFGDLPYVDSSAAATGEVVYRLAKKIDWQPTAAFATCAYTAISTDTGSFQFSNTSSRIFGIAAELAAWGADPSEIAERVYATQSRARVQILKHVLEGLRFEANGKIAAITVWQSDMRNSNALKYDLEGLVNIPRSIEGVQAAVQIREVIPGKEYRISLRSKKPIDVERIASGFGGGGHKYAAGCTLYGAYDDICGQLFAALTDVTV